VRVLSIVHQADAGPGVFAEAAAARGDELLEWRPHEGPPAEAGYEAVMVFGGAMHADQEEAHPWLRQEKEFLRAALADRVPVLGVCLGAQLLADAAGARPRRAARPEIGWLDVELDSAAADDPLLGVLPARFESFQWHSYEFPLPPGATPLARSDTCLQAYRLDGGAWGLQFHAEVTAESVQQWLADYREDEDAVASGLDPRAVAAATEPRIAAWNDLGRGIARRFLDKAWTTTRA
jgi:GMP synthase (glutamine-hydrolysing)